MAKALNMQFSGRIGPLVGCLRNGKYYYRSRPAKMRHTKATKASSSIFAVASRAGKIMRQYLQHSIPNPKDLNMQRRLLGSISKWLRLSNGLPPQPTTAIPFVQHFNFNPDKSLEETFKVPVSFIQTGPGQMELQIPAFVPTAAIKAPAHTTQIEMCISAVSLNIANYNSFGDIGHAITVAYNDTPQPPQQIILPLQNDPGNMLIAAVQLRFLVEKRNQLVYAKADKQPGAVVGAVYL